VAHGTYRSKVGGTSMNNRLSDEVSYPSALPSVVILCGLLFTGFILPTDSSVQVFQVAAFGAGAALVLGTGIEVYSNIRGLLRTDILMLWVLYGLTFLEFLFPQPKVESLVSASAATSGTYAVFLGLAGLVVGRHLVPKRNRVHNNLTVVTRFRPSGIFP